VFCNRHDMPLARIDQFYEYFNTPSARESAQAVLRAMLDTRPVVARVARVRHPMLVVWGRDDRVFPAAYALKLAREVSDARLELFDSGHSPHEEKPAEFVFTVQEFFEGRR
jgi:pimeloyl-ACP methyl ester carboxylesterase